MSDLAACKLRTARGAVDRWERESAELLRKAAGYRARQMCWYYMLTREAEDEARLFIAELLGMVGELERGG